MSEAVRCANCRWCNKRIVFVWNKWQHFTRVEQKECPTPIPFVEEMEEACN